MQDIMHSFKARFRRWVDRRAPRAGGVTLKHRSIYVLPSRQGLGFMLVIVLLWILGTNYENNLVLALAFLLISLLIVSVVHAFKNLSGLRLGALKGQPTFVGDYAEFELLLETSPGSPRESLRLGWDPALMREVDLLKSVAARVALSHRARRRGWLKPGRLLVESYYPLGFIRAWSWIYLDAQTLVYPAPRSTAEPPLAHLIAHSGEQVSPENQEEFQGFRPYVTGAPLAHVAWKLYARGAGLHLKDYTGYQSEQVWLDWERLQGLDTESRLSQLCYWVLAFGKTSAEYGLRLPDLTLPPGRSSAHQAQALRALALYGLAPSSERKAAP